ncbi:PiggyBac transposable element-derived protein 4 [Trichinella zimbabwensis]|uniref:PiggyBac transposable element-derived protein 4 n=1 Tax=Trichinella zimbabwensis TaxID=268475 RepID=A0A0V1HPZ8_9BILA|nr:PiggyBac transposable element-derived protein 4 [Trichinella zimbabwensis]
MSLRPSTSERILPAEEFSDIEEDISETEDAPELSSDYQPPSGTDSSSDESSEGAFSPSTNALMSRNGLMQWYSSPMKKREGRLAEPNVIKLPPGPTRYAIARITDIRSSFALFISSRMEKIILQMTNLEGKRLYKDDWKEIDETELHAYISVLILAGVYKSHGEATNSLWNTENGRPIFPSVMSLDNFQRISRIIRFDDRETRSHRREKDPLAAIRDIWDDWVARLPMMCNPGAYVTADERLIPFKGRCPFRQYMPKKPAKYGIKVWTLCDAKTSYAWNMQIYTGKHASAGLKGNNVTCDNFFTSHELAVQLLKKKLTILGTIKKNKPVLPQELLEVGGRAVHSSKFVFTEQCTAVSYIPKKHRMVLVLSTMHKDASLSTGDGCKPEMILDYNATKGGVDNMDKMLASYTCQRMTSGWPLVVFYNIIDVSANNGYLLWTHCSPEWNASKKYRRRLYLEELGKALITPQILRRKRIPRAFMSAHLVQKVQSEEQGTAGSTVQAASNRKRSRCELCDATDNKTSTRCVKCSKYICKAHTCIYCVHCADK